MPAPHRAVDGSDDNLRVGAAPGTVAAWWARRAWTVVLVVEPAAIGFYYLAPRAGVTQAVLLTTLNFISAALALRAAAASRGKPRLVWALLATAMGLASTANLFYYGFPLTEGRPLPFPSVVDVLWLSTYPCFILALLALAGRQRRQDRGGDLLDAAILVAGGGSLMWQFVIEPVVADKTMQALAHAVTVAYPTMDLLVFAFVVRFVVSVSRRTGTLNLLLGSFVFLLVADTVYALGLEGGWYHLGGPADGLWMTSYMLISVAALHPSCGQPVRRSGSSNYRLSPARLAFLSASVLVGPALMSTRPRGLAVIAVISALTVLLVLGRMTGLNRDLAAAGVELESRATTDSLTGLLNRSAFNARLELALAQPVRAGASTWWCCSWTSTTSRTSTTASAIPAGTSCSGSWPSACTASRGLRTWLRAWAGTSSPCCSVAVPTGL